MLSEPFDDISAEDLQALVDAGAGESRTLEYKRQPHGRAERDKQELCADVSAFANGSGGNLLFGIDETDGQATALVGIDLAQVDGEIGRLQQILNSGVRPAIPGLRLRSVNIDGDKAALICHIPQSWRAPHLVRVPNDSFRMFTRNDAGKMPLDADGIRLAFHGAGETAERINLWHSDRIAKIISGDMPVQLEPGPRMVMHIIPFEAVRSPNQFTPAELKPHDIHWPPMGTRSWNHHINVDGYVTHTGSVRGDKERAPSSYCQVFRSGAVEAVDTSCHTNRFPGTAPGRLPSIAYEQRIRERANEYLNSLASVGASFPMAMFVSLIGYQSYRLTMDWPDDDRPIDRDPLLLPNGIVESPSDLDATLRPIFDGIWNACGMPHSPNFADDGTWRPYK